MISLHTRYPPTPINKKRIIKRKKSNKIKLKAQSIELKKRIRRHKCKSGPAKSQDPGGRRGRISIGCNVKTPEKKKKVEIKQSTRKKGRGRG